MRCTAPRPVVGNPERTKADLQPIGRTLQVDRGNLRSFSMGTQRVLIVSESTRRCVDERQQECVGVVDSCDQPRESMLHLRVRR